MKKDRHAILKRIEEADFGKKFFGYNPDEVDDFLMEIKSAYRELLQENERLKLQTAEYKEQQILERVKKKIEKMKEEKEREVHQLEARKKEIELEIEKLKLIHKKMYERVKLALFEMSQIFQELRQDVKSYSEGEGSRDRGEITAQELFKQDSQGGRGEAKDKGDGSSGKGKGK
jgi:cell division initiation protein